ncbi:MAG: GNAT family N-acetyltransferase [Herpetosiphonaceae bacterium]|nr:GNAT family N-acetyltransferase [Herpetosiphonaceae bacterium]
MLFFRRVPAINNLTYRPFTATDLPAVEALIAQTEWTVLAIPQEELNQVLADNLSLVAEHGGKIWAVALASWSNPPSAWIRALVLHHYLRPSEIVPAVLARLESHLYNQGVQNIYMMSDDRDVTWLRPVLLTYGFNIQVEVIGYEKRTMFIPDWGNSVVGIRPAEPSDVPTIAAIDTAAFAPEWVKNAAILGSVFSIAPCYLVAVLNAELIGYAFATTHHGGLVAHLVRIAVAPAYQHQAVGIRLLAAVVEWCRQNNVQVLSLNTQSSNRHAQQLYEWFGFLRNGDHQVVLTKHVQYVASAQTELNLIPG